MKVIAGVGPDEIIKVLNFLKSSQELGMIFDYPFLNDKKKLKFTMTGLKLAKYLVTVLGSNIKTVTWMGDDVNFTNEFQGGSYYYLEEDVNELDGDYDSMNSAVNIIEKLGPLDAEAPYVIEFKKAPEQKDWANFMISLQGIGDEISISDLYGRGSGENGTAVNEFGSNKYTNTTAMEPAYDTDTFTPITPGTPINWGYYSSTPSAGSGTDLGTTITCSTVTPVGSIHWKIGNAPAGYYEVIVGATILTDTQATVASTYSTADSVVGSKYAITANNSDVTGISGGYIRVHTASYCFQLTEPVTTAVTLFSTQVTGYNSTYANYGRFMTAREITQAQFENLRPQSP